MTETRETVEKLKQELQDVRTDAGAQGPRVAMRSTLNEMPATEPPGAWPVYSGRTRGRAARAAAANGDVGQLSVDLVSLGLKESDRTELAAAVQTTRAIIEVHG